MTTYNLDFFKDAKKEWDRLDESIRSQFRKKLAQRLTNPRVPSARLSGMPDCYKIKLRSVGYRLIYQVEDETVTVVVVAIGKREHDDAYRRAAQRL